MIKALYPYNFLFDLSMRVEDFPGGLPNDFDGSLRYVLSSLEEPDRKMVLYRYKGGMTYEQIAQLMEYNVKTVAWRINRALKLIKTSYRFSILKYGISGWVNKEVEEVQDMFFDMSTHDFDDIFPLTRITRQSIYSSDISNLTCDTLANSGGIHTLGDLTKLTWNELNDIPGISNHAAIEIRAALKKYGLNLLPEPIGSSPIVGARRKPQKLNPSSYANRLLYQVYGEPWSHPLPEDYDDAFSYIIDCILTKEESRVLDDRFAQGMTLIEIQTVEYIPTERIDAILNTSLHRIKSIGAMPLLINGLKYYSEEGVPVQDIPLLIVMKHNETSLSFKTVKALSAYKVFTVGQLHDRIVHDFKLLKVLSEESLLEIESTLDYYHLTKGLIPLREYLSKKVTCSLLRAGINSIDILKNTDADTLMKIHGFGARTVSNIKARLEQYDLESRGIRDQQT